MAISIETVFWVKAMTRYCKGCINIEKFQENAYLYEHLEVDRNPQAVLYRLSVTLMFSGFGIVCGDLYITFFYGDGGFVSVRNIYAPNFVSEKECIGHVQKRVGTRLRKLKKTEKALLNWVSLTK